MKTIHADLYNSDSKIAIIVSKFNKHINNNLLEGAIHALQKIGQIKDENITIIWVPGSYELPLVLNILLKYNSNFSAVIALGTIIKGETDHFKHIASSVSSSIIEIMQKREIPIGFGILITKNMQQALDRSGGKFGNKGYEAAMTVLEMINLINIVKN
ncbi:6,7-dimethyl-8-ribityllumazine synthase [Candidatus Tachikawaea gelatinosa]|uniref:6,7-dimethyl-8-ribityllumazine synthase n=1 Tax=Candidatus Tachikawaea gelatinosa TaxID=1410383 RepID=A0A090AM71_9ENTR|nr:6,7-dimethyl-8-ribityllumazine synthase [Candidatus Tachikawaea gelatinosa]BAP58754.1 6 7-dimethyl-8-ribityllumazine synthase [Candidatus Tachikawaea gelatinosa]